LSYKREEEIMKACFQSFPTSDLPRPKAEDKRGVFSARVKRSEVSLFVVGALRQLAKFSRCGLRCKPKR